jgi:hypothetical protein
VETILRTKLYDKRDDFNFPIVTFPFICSNFPAAPAYGVYENLSSDVQSTKRTTTSHIKSLNTKRPQFMSMERQVIDWNMNEHVDELNRLDRDPPLLPKWNSTRQYIYKQTIKRILHILSDSQRDNLNRNNIKMNSTIAGLEKTT